MANLQYSADLLNYILFKSGEKTDGTSDYDAQALVYLNSAYRKLWQGGGEFDPTINEDWTWLREKGNIILQAKITTGTISVTNNSATATLSASQATSTAGWFFKVDTHEGIFRVSAHTAATTGITLDSVYTGSTDAAASYKLVKLDYTLASDAIEILSPMRTAHRSSRMSWFSSKIEGSSVDRLIVPYELKAGVPDFFAQVDDTTVRFDRYQDSDLIRVDYEYKKRPADLTNSASEEPVIPLRHRQVLANIALVDLLLDKNDDRADTTSLIAKQGLKSMSIENQNRQAQMDGDFGKIHSRTDTMRGGVHDRRLGEAYS